MVYCPRCGNQNEDSAQFCMSCGQSLAVRPETMKPPQPQPPEQKRGFGRMLLLALLALAAVGAIAVSAYVLLPHLQSGGEWIAYQTKDPDDTWGLWVVRPDGQDRDELMSGVDGISYTSVVKGEQQYKYTPFAPKDDLMLFRTWEWEEWSLYTYALGEATAKALAQGADIVWYEFSPDGDRVAVVVREEGENSLQVMDANGENKVTLLTGVEGGIGWDWVPNSSKLLVRLYDEGGHRLFVIDDQGEERLPLVDGMDDVDYIVSPEGDRIAYAAASAGKWDVYAAQVDGSDSIPLAGGMSDVTLFGFSPDAGQLIMNASADGYSYDLYLMESDGTGRVTLASDMDDARGIFVPGGTQIFFVVEQDDLESFYLVGEDGADQTFAARRIDDLTVSFTPDARTAVVAVEKGGDWDLYAVEVATGEQISLLTNADALGSLLTMDDKRVLFSAREGDNWTLYLADLDGEDTVALAGPADGFEGYDASPDGRKIVYSEVKLGVSRIYVIDADGKNREKLVDDGFSPIWSD